MIRKGEGRLVGRVVTVGEKDGWGRLEGWLALVRSPVVFRRIKMVIVLHYITHHH